MFVVKFMGGLGNQLLQLNFCHYLKEKYPEVEIRCDITSYNNFPQNSITDSIHGGFLISKLPFKTIDKIEWRKFIIIKSGNSDSIPNINIKYNYYFEGYWPLKIPFKKYINFNDVFDIDRIPENNKSIENQILSYKENSVAVHIRCGDYNNLFDLGNVATKAYYNNAITYILNNLPDAYFFIFSNDINWARNNLQIKKNVFFVEANNDKEGAVWDLYLMSKCSNFIISNSSFSLWAQFFCNNVNKIVLTPEYWTNIKTSYSKDGTSAFQKFSYMKSISNIPYMNKTNPEILFIIHSNRNFLALRRFIVAALNQYSDKIKIVVFTNKTPIKKAIMNFNNINKCIVLASNNNIKKILKNERYYSYIKTDYYLMQDSIDILLKEIKCFSEYKKIFLPIQTQSHKTTIVNTSHKYPLPVIINNKVQNKEEIKLTKPYFCYIDFNKKIFNNFYLSLKNIIKKYLFLFRSNI